MGLEAANYIEELNVDNPTFQDFLTEGDDHLRGIKRALKQTFPGMGGRLWRKRAVSVSGPLTLSDNGSLVIAGGTLTLTPADAAVLGNGWMVMVKATAGNVTIDPGQNINGAASQVVPTGYTAILMSDGGEFFSMLVYQDVPVAVQAFAAGTKIVFPQTAAPTGWTKVVSGTHNDAVLRFTTGDASTGGADAFTATFGAGKTTAGHALTIGQMPAHAFDYTRKGPTVGGTTAGGDADSVGNQVSQTNTLGSNQTHTHPMNSFNIKYVDAIVASKD